LLLIMGYQRLVIT